MDRYGLCKESGNIYMAKDKVGKYVSYDDISEIVEENRRLREALDTIEGMATDTTFDIQKVAQQALGKAEGE